MLWGYLVGILMLWLMPIFVLIWIFKEMWRARARARGYFVCAVGNEVGSRGFLLLREKEGGGRREDGGEKVTWGAEEEGGGETRYASRF